MGRQGEGGRGLACQSYQLYNIVIENVSLEYVNDVSVTGAGRGGSKVLLTDAYLKLLPGKVYSLIGRNGVGKSTLLRRMNDCKIPGFPPHISTMLVSQEVVCHNTHTPIDVILQNHGRMNKKVGDSNRLYSIARVEEEMDALDKSANNYAVEMEHLCNLIAELEEDDNNNSGERGGAIWRRGRATPFATLAYRRQHSTSPRPNCQEVYERRSRSRVQ